MNMLGKERILGSFFALIVILLLVVAGPAQALEFTITDIPTTNKGDTLSYDIVVNVLDTEQLPLEDTTLIIRSRAGNFDEFRCMVFEDGSFSCTRQKGSDSAPLDPDSSIHITRNNVNGTFGYGYFSGGDLIFHVTWDTPVNLRPGEYGTKLIIESNDHVFSSDEKLFNIITPARPGDRFSIRARGTRSLVNGQELNSQNSLSLYYSNNQREQGQSTLELHGPRNQRLGIIMDNARLIDNSEDEIIIKYRGHGSYNRNNVNFREITIIVDKHTRLVDISGLGDINFQANDLAVTLMAP